MDQDKIYTYSGDFFELKYFKEVEESDFYPFRFENQMFATMIRGTKEIKFENNCGIKFEPNQVFIPKDGGTFFANLPSISATKNPVCCMTLEINNNYIKI